MGFPVAAQNDAESRRAAPAADERPAGVALFGRRVARASCRRRLSRLVGSATPRGAPVVARLCSRRRLMPRHNRRAAKCESPPPGRCGRFGSRRWSVRFAADADLLTSRRVPHAHSSRVALRRACGRLWAVPARRAHSGVSLVTIARRIASRTLPQFGALGVGCCYTAGRACGGRYAPFYTVRFHSTRRMETRPKCCLVARGTTSQAANDRRHSLRRASHTGAALHFIRSAHSRAATASRKKRHPVRRAKMVTHSRPKPKSTTGAPKTKKAPQTNKKADAPNKGAPAQFCGHLASATLKNSSVKFAYKTENTKQSNKKRQKITAQAVVHPATVGLPGKSCQPTKAADTRCSCLPSCQTSRRPAAP